MVPSKSAFLVLVGSIHSLSSINAFTTPNHFSYESSNIKCKVSSSNLYASSSAEDSAKALTDYMVKSHEEKLRAVKAAEEKKDLEIQTLKEELDSIKANGGSSSMELASTSSSKSITTTNESVEELAARLASYQKFMSDYIVKASEQKFKAVKEAEMALTKKYEAKLLLLSGNDNAAPPVVSTPTKNNPAFEKRNAKVAAAAGKSRWGEKEVEKAQIAATTTTEAAVPVAAAAPAEKVIDVVDIPAEVIEADHGLRADGGVGGLTLAERVMLGSQASSKVEVGAVVKNASTYEKRNAYLLKSANAGKSRWGDAEIANVQRFEEQKALSGSNSGSSSPVVAPIDVKEADHGLRADGGVGGPSLSERVNLGTALMQSA